MHLAATQRYLTMTRELLQGVRTWPKAVAVFGVAKGFLKFLECTRIFAPSQVRMLEIRLELFDRPTQIAESSGLLKRRNIQF